MTDTTRSSRSIMDNAPATPSAPTVPGGTAPGGATPAPSAPTR
jgi:hypothetical protein